MTHVSLKKGRPFHTGIVLGKNEYLHAFTEDDGGINFCYYYSDFLLKVYFLVSVINDHEKATRNV